MIFVFQMIGNITKLYCIILQKRLILKIAFIINKLKLYHKGFLWHVPVIKDHLNKKEVLAQEYI
jgi:hypothetical protein